MVDRVLLERILSDIRSNTEELKNASDITWTVYQTDTRSRRFVERTLHILVEACIDAAHHIISDEKLREPSGYRDAFTVLAENGILLSDDLATFHNMAGFRNLLVHYYERVDDETVYGVFRRNLSDFDRFTERITDYLKRIGQLTGSAT